MLSTQGLQTQTARHGAHPSLKHSDTRENLLKDGVRAGRGFSHEQQIMQVSCTNTQPFQPPVSHQLRFGPHLHNLYSSLKASKLHAAAPLGRICFWHGKKQDMKTRQNIYFSFSSRKSFCLGDHRHSTLHFIFSCLFIAGSRSIFWDFCSTLPLFLLLPPHKTPLNIVHLKT